MYGGRNTNPSHYQHHHFPNHHHKGPNHGPGGTAPTSPESALAADIFEQFVVASTFKSVLHHYRHMCDVLRLRPQNIRHFYPKLRSKIRSWKAQAIWSKFDKRMLHRCYNHGKACSNAKVLIIGAGPCGLRSAIEAQLLGAKVVVIEKRDRFSRNNVLHLWPFVIADLKGLGAKKFYGKFCAGAIDHISIRQLQCMLLKMALLLGVEVFEGVAFEELLEPPEDQSQSIGWHARFSPPEHPVNQYEFDALIGADGKRNTLSGFKRKEFRGKLAIAITANFINKHSEQEARVQEISGVAFIFNQKFFKDLYAETGIDLENIVYYKDDTHYFVMTAKKHSLIDKGVILRDLPDTQQLLHPNNVDRKALCDYAREAADFSTGYQLPHLDFAVNHYGKPDIAMFDFTSMFAAENACRVVEKRGHKILQCLVGDSLLEPFWPTGSGCARGFLSSFDACWAIRSWASNKMTPLEVIAERESIYRLLAQTTPENLSKDYASYTSLPTSRYPTVNLKALLPFQVRHLYVTDDPEEDGGLSTLQDGAAPLQESGSAEDIPRKRKRKDSLIQLDALLAWCQKQIAHKEDLKIEDLNSFKDGRILCTILHRYRPDMMDLEILEDLDQTQRCQISFDILEKEFGILPIMSGAEMIESNGAERADIVSYIAQIHDALRGEIPHSMGPRPPLKVLKAQTNTEHSDFATMHKAEEVVVRTHLQNNNSGYTNGRVACKVMDVSKDEAQKRKRRSLSGSLDKLDDEKTRSKSNDSKPRPFSDKFEDFSDRVRGLEAKFKGESSVTTSIHQQKPKDLNRAVGKLEKTDWNLSAIEKKIEDNMKYQVNLESRERVPRWNKDIYNDKCQNIERRLRENGENEERIAKYLDIDASLKRLERKLREGSTLETGLRGHNKVSNLANQLSSKLIRKEEDPSAKNVCTSKLAKTMVLPTSTSDLCYFCGTRVYLVERLSAEGKYFHRKCFKCSYCSAFLRLGNYIYDRENRYGGKFFCIPHFGLTAKSRVQKKADFVSITDNKKSGDASSFLGRVDAYANNYPQQQSPKTNNERATKPNPSLLSTPKGGVLPLDRGATPERVEFENSVIEQSDEEEYLSEDEWTDRNFGASANELDDDDDDSDYSDLSDEEVDDNEILLEGSQKLTVDETRRLAETWKKRYSTDVVGRDRELYSESDIDDMSEHGVEGDESLIPTEGEIGDDDDDDDEEDDEARRARELRRQEFNINVSAPPRMGETSDSESDTEVGTSEESDTQIDTDSEFADDQEASNVPKEIPKIVIDEMPKEEVSPTQSPLIKTQKNNAKPSSNYPKKEYVSQVIEMNPTPNNESTERSSSLSNLALSKSGAPNPHTEQLKRLIQRTESTEAVSAQRSLLKREYLLGSSSTAPKKSVSSADLGNRFKSFMDKISETQKKLNPAPEPSPSMQAFLNLSNKSNLMSCSQDRTSGLRNSPLRTTYSTSVIGQDTKVQLNDEKASENISSPQQSGGESTDNSSLISDDEGKLITFSPKIDEIICKNSSENQNNGSDIGANVPTSTSNTADIIISPISELIGEKGTLDSEQSEKTSISKILDENIDIFGTNTKEDNLFDELKESEQSGIHPNAQIEAVNIELLSTENLNNSSSEMLNLADKDLSNDISTFTDDDNLDDDFDQLAKDALNDMEDNTITSHSTIEQGTERTDQDTGINITLLKSSSVEVASENASGTSDCDDDGTKDIPMEYTSKSDSLLCPLVDKNQEESGFRSMDDNKELSSSENQSTLEALRKEGNEADKTVSSITSTLKNWDNQKTETEAGTTEADLSDLIDDSETLALKSREIEQDLHSPDTESDIVPPQVSSIPKFNSSNIFELSSVPRIASQESLGDSDSAISVGVNRTISTLPKMAAFAEMEDFDFMDLSNGESSPEEKLVSFGYSKLEDSPTTHVYDEAIVEVAPVAKEEPSSSDATPQATKIASYQTRSQSKSLEVDQSEKESPPSRSFSEPPCLNESLPMASPSPRYEGYIPRFKDRMTPFSLVRDSIDVRKCSSSKPLFTPSKEDILQREKNERERMNELSNQNSSESPQTSSSSSEAVKTNRNPKAKVGDVVKDMVMSRIGIKPSDKNRRGSKNALQLSLHSSISSLAAPDSSFLSNISNLSSFTTTDDNSPDPKNQTSTTNLTLNKNHNESESNSNSSTPNLYLMNKNTESPSLSKDVNNYPRSVLPATPLTHPEKFKREIIPKRELFKSSPQLHLTSQFSPTKSPYTPFFKPLNQRVSSAMPLHAEQTEIMSQSLVASGLESPLSRTRRMSEGELRRRETATTETGERLQGMNSSENAEKPRKDPNERLRELLEERRRKGIEEVKDVRLRDKDFCLRECLEEYRQKRSSAPVIPQCIPSTPISIDPQNKDEIVHPKLNLGLTQRHFHRPSRLELESMQIFSNPSRVMKDSAKVLPDKSTLSDSPVKALPPSNLASISSTTSATVGLSLSNVPDQGIRISSKPEAAVPEKRSTKKSKDRERRRSLIQFVAGMFSKSDEKKKDKDEPGIESDSAKVPFVNKPPIMSPLSPISSSVSPSKELALPSKSPSVKERFTKFRLSRAKEKRKSIDLKNRSASAGSPFLSSSDGYKDQNPSSSAVSLPTSPSRTIFSFLSSSPVRPLDKSKSSSSGSTTSYFTQRFSPACIKEEKDSEDDSPLGPPGSSFEKGGNSSNVSTPSIRRQKAALRAAKQAEQKRLRMAQEIQRQLEECEVKTRELEERGILVEKSLIGETKEGSCCDEEVLMKEWFSLVHEKNSLVRWQEELAIKARELELEDRHLRLENELRQRMTSAEREKSREDIEREGKILAEIISIIEQKDALVTLLEEDRQRYAEEDRDLELLHARKILKNPSYEGETSV